MPNVNDICLHTHSRDIFIPIFWEDTIAPSNIWALNNVGVILDKSHVPSHRLSLQEAGGQLLPDLLVLCFLTEATPLSRSRILAFK